MREIFIHVGYGKTATTWLQEKVFRTLGPDIYLGKREGDFPSWLLRLNYLDDFAFAAQKEALRAEIAAQLAGTTPAIISSEAFTNLSAIFQQIERLRFIFNSPKIILVLRHPIDWLISNYKYCVEHEGFFRPLEDYLDFGARRTPFALEKRAPFYIPDFYYDEVVARYRAVFGEERVLVLRYEDFVSKPGEFGQALSQFVGISLPDFDSLAREKVLPSKEGADLQLFRRRNFEELTRRCGFAVDKLRPIAEPEHLLSPVLRERLRSQLAPHCAAYYQDLAEER